MNICTERVYIWGKNESYLEYHKFPLLFKGSPFHLLYLHLKDDSFKKKNQKKKKTSSRNITDPGLEQVADLIILESYTHHTHFL